MKLESNLDSNAQAWFRQAMPYINLHKGEVLVIVLEAEILDLPNAQNIFADLALLNTLGMKLVFLLDIKTQLRQALQNANLLKIANNKILLDKNSLDLFLSLSQTLARKLEAAFSLGLPASSSYTPHIKIISGNLISAMPLGVKQGVDFSFLGKVRKIDKKNILAILDLDFGVFLPPWGYSVTSEIFGLNLDDLALAVAKELSANKIIFLTKGLDSIKNSMVSGVTPEIIDKYLQENDKLADIERDYLTIASRASRAGVKRVHILDANLDGVLLKELFSAEGVGIMVTKQAYESLRKATLNDISALLSLLKPLEEAGILIHRSKSWLEADIDKFTLLDLDANIVGCVALYPYLEESMAELACLAVDTNYRNQQKAVLLLQDIEKKCRALNLEKLFVLTTQTSHWFLANGFSSGTVADLPKSKREKYDINRGSKIFIKNILN